MPAAILYMHVNLVFKDGANAIVSFIYTTELAYISNYHKQSKIIFRPNSNGKLVRCNKSEIKKEN